MKGWGTPHQVALYVGRPVETVRKWAKTGAVPTACDLTTKRLVIHAGEAGRYAATRRRQKHLTSRAA